MKVNQIKNFKSGKKLRSVLDKNCFKYYVTSNCIFLVEAYNIFFFFFILFHKFYKI